MPPQAQAAERTCGRELSPEHARDARVVGRRRVVKPDAVEDAQKARCEKVRIERGELLQPEKEGGALT